MSTNYSTKSKDGPLTRRREPYQFMMWLGLAGSGLLFISLLAVFLYRKTTLAWYDVNLPRVFWLSSLLIFTSSISLFEAQLAFRTERFRHYRICMGITFVLGLAFTVTQALGWLEMIDLQYPGSNVSPVYFVYLITGLHFLHILGGLAFLGILFTEAIRNASYIDAFVYSINGPNILRIKLLGIYWHFVGALWLVLFFAILFYQTLPLGAA